jgi:hypothetical protein
VNAPYDLKRHGFRIALVLSALLCASLRSVCADTFVVSAPRDVEDVALLDREFGGWNFGSSILIEAGFMPGLYELHHGASLIRFNVSGLGCGDVRNAKLRLYKPKCSVQMSPVEIQVFEVAEANGAWTEGAAECGKSPEASTWNELREGKPWTGGPGCSMPDVDFHSPALDTQHAPLNEGAWMEFTLPVSLVQRWIEKPQANAGLYIMARDHGAKLGDHVYFHSSEHHSGKGPRLIIEGPSAPPRTTYARRPHNKVYPYPEADEQFERWLDGADNRYTRWVEACRMTPEQAVLPYYWEVIIRGAFLLPRCRQPLSRGLETLDEMVAKGDEAGVREELKQVRQYLLVWEYIREVRWYDSGPLADELSPLQLGILWGQEIFGNMLKKYAHKSWKRLTPEELDIEVRDAVERTRKTLRLTPEQATFVDPVVEKHERLEHYYIEKFMDALEECRELIEREDDSQRMFNCVKRLHENHELFLYHQSFINTPRWTVFMEHADALPLAKRYLRARRKEYNAARISRNAAHAEAYGRSNPHVH